MKIKIARGHTTLKTNDDWISVKQTDRKKNTNTIENN